jgi:hypothetical protein
VDVVVVGVESFGVFGVTVEDEEACHASFVSGGGTVFQPLNSRKIWKTGNSLPCSPCFSKFPNLVAAAGALGGDDQELVDDRYDHR